MTSPSDDYYKLLMTAGEEDLTGGTWQSPTGADDDLADVAKFLGLSFDETDPLTGQPILQDFADLMQNWGAWGMHSDLQYKVPTDSGSPPYQIMFTLQNNMPLEAQRILTFLSQHPSLENAIDPGLAQGAPITLDDVETYNQTVTDDAITADGFLKGIEADGNAKEAMVLNPSFGYAAALLADFDLSQTQGTPSQAALSAQKWFAQNPQVVRNIEIAGGGGNSAVLTKSALVNYLKAESGDLNAALGLAGASQVNPSFLTPEIANVMMLMGNWQAWGMHQGTTSGSGLPPEAAGVLNYLATNPTLMSAIEAEPGGVSPSSYTFTQLQNFLKSAVADVNFQGESGGSYLDETAITTEYQFIVGDDKNAQVAANPLNEAIYLLQNATAFGLKNGINMNALPAPDLPAAAQAALNDLKSNPALNALLAPIGTMTESSLQQYVQGTEQKLNTANTDLSKWTTANPGASAESVSLAHNAALLLGSWPEISHVPYEFHDDNITIDDLQPIAADPTHYGVALSDAAAAFSQPAFYNMLYISGGNSQPNSATFLNVVTAQDVDAYLKSTNVSVPTPAGSNIIAPLQDRLKDDMQKLETGAFELMRGGDDDFDRSFEKGFNYGNLGQYTVQQKQVLLLDLLDDKSALNYVQTDHTYGTISNYDDINTVLDAHIKALQDDAGTMALFSADLTSQESNILENQANVGKYGLTPAVIGGVRDDLLNMADQLTSLGPNGQSFLSQLAGQLGDDEAAVDDFKTMADTLVSLLPDDLSKPGWDPSGSPSFYDDAQQIIEQFLGMGPPIRTRP